MLKIKGDKDINDNPYQILEISFEKKDDNYYANFHFSTKELAKTFYSYMRITMASLISDENEPQEIAFILINPPSKIEDVVSIKGNINQAIKILIDEDTLKGKYKHTLEDVREEEDLQKFKHESKNCTYLASLGKLSTVEKPSELKSQKKQSPEQPNNADIIQPISQRKVF
jgi:hypothetical protein